MTCRPGLLPDAPSWRVALARLTASAVVGGIALAGVIAAGLAVLTA